jgi:hypothetical protein
MGRQDAWKSDATLCRITFRWSRSRSRCFRLDVGQRCILEMDFLGSYNVCQSVNFNQVLRAYGLLFRPVSA